MSKQGLQNLKQKPLKNISEPKQQDLTQAVLQAYPDTQAIYLFGTWATNYQHPQSDLDIALLLPYKTSKSIDFWQWLGLNDSLATISQTDKVDLINLREVNTVFKKEIIMANRRIFCANETVADEFEMLVLSMYQQLNFERKDIIAKAIETGRFRL